MPEDGEIEDRCLEPRGDLTLSPEARRRILECRDPAQLERWTDRVLTIATVAELWEETDSTCPAGLTDEKSSLPTTSPATVLRYRRDVGRSSTPGAGSPARGRLRGSRSPRSSNPEPGRA